MLLAKLPSFAPIAATRASIVKSFVDPKKAAQNVQSKAIEDAKKVRGLLSGAYVNLLFFFLASCFSRCERFPYLQSGNLAFQKCAHQNQKKNRRNKNRKEKSEPAKNANFLRQLMKGNDERKKKQKLF